MDMLLLPLLSRIFAVLQQDITGTDDASMHRKLKESYLNFFIALMNANLDGVFISSRNKPEFENLLSAVLAQTSDTTDPTCQRLAFGFFGKSVIAWATSGVHADAFADSAMSEKSKNVANGLSGPTNQHAVSKEERIGMRLEGYENFVYQRLVPACFEVPASPQFNLRSNQPVNFSPAAVCPSVIPCNTADSKGRARDGDAPSQYAAGARTGNGRIPPHRPLAQDELPAELCGRVDQADEDAAGERL